MCRMLAVSVATILLAAGPAGALAPEMPFALDVEDSEGRPFDGEAGMWFILSTIPTHYSPYDWYEYQVLDIQKGRLEARLGSVTPFPPLHAAEQYYLWLYVDWSSPRTETGGHLDPGAWPRPLRRLAAFESGDPALRILADEVETLRHELRRLRAQLDELRSRPATAPSSGEAEGDGRRVRDRGATKGRGASDG